MKNFRSIVILRAFHLLSETGQSWPECLKKAWQIYRLNKELHRGEICFYFEKKSGEIRKARGTLKIDYEFKTQSQPSPKTLTYYDLDFDGFRCFKIENFIMLAKPKKIVTLRQKRIKKYLQSA